jgi:hypothetical protein
VLSVFVVVVVTVPSVAVSSTTLSPFALSVVQVSLPSEIFFSHVLVDWSANVVTVVTLSFAVSVVTVVTSPAAGVLLVEHTLLPAHETQGSVHVLVVAGVTVGSSVTVTVVPSDFVFLVTVLPSAVLVTQVVELSVASVVQLAGVGAGVVEVVVSDWFPVLGPSTVPSGCVTVVVTVPSGWSTLVVTVQTPLSHGSAVVTVVFVHTLLTQGVEVVTVTTVPLPYVVVVDVTLPLTSNSSTTVTPVDLSVVLQVLVPALSVHVFVVLALESSVVVTVVPSVF